LHRGCPLLDPCHVLPRARIDADTLALRDEKRHADDGAGFEFRQSVRFMLDSSTWPVLRFRNFARVTASRRPGVMESTPTTMHGSPSTSTFAPILMSFMP
jgi:hypothetical protein